MSTLKWINGQAFAHYSEWECYQAGFHRVGYSDEHRDRAAEILGDRRLLLDASRHVIESWPITTAVHLSNPNINKHAWMGHAACFLRCGAGERSSVAGYWALSPEGRDQANATVWGAYLEWKLTFMQVENYLPPSDQLEFLFFGQPSNE